MKRMHAAIAVSLRFPDVEPVHPGSAQRADVICPETCKFFSHSFPLRGRQRCRSPRNYPVPAFKARCHAGSMSSSEFHLTVRACHHPSIVTDVHDLLYRLIARGHSAPVPRVMSVSCFHHAESGGLDPQCLTGHPAAFEAVPDPCPVRFPWKRTTDSNRNP